VLLPEPSIPSTTNSFPGSPAIGRMPILLSVRRELWLSYPIWQPATRAEVWRAEVWRREVRGLGRRKRHPARSPRKRREARVASSQTAAAPCYRPACGEGRGGGLFVGRWGRWASNSLRIGNAPGVPHAPATLALPTRYPPPPPHGGRFLRLSLPSMPHARRLRRVSMAFTGHTSWQQKHSMQASRSITA